MNYETLNNQLFAIKCRIAAKIQNKVKAKEIRPATEEEIMSINAVPGYASPIGVDKSKTIVIVDDLIAEAKNIVIGANEKDYHFENASFKRDFDADIIADIVEAFDGALCPVSDKQNHKLKSVRGIEVGNIFQLGTKYTEALNAYYTDKNGKRQTVIMGSYGIGVGRLLACLAEEYSTENGLRLPITIAPYHVVLIAIKDNEEISQKADELYQHLIDNNVEVIYDDRDKKSATAGEKFADADLIGYPIRLTVSKRSLKNGGIEAKMINNTETEIIPEDKILDFLSNKIDEQFDIINSKLRSVEVWNETE